MGYQEVCLEHVIRSYQPNMSSVLTPCGKAGKKPNQSIRKRKATSSDDKRDVSQFSDPLDDGNLSVLSPSDKWKVVFVKDTKMRKCYGCGGSVRQNISFEPPSPWNIVLTRRVQSIYASWKKFPPGIYDKGECILSPPKKMRSGKKHECQRKLHSNIPRH